MTIALSVVSPLVTVSRSQLTSDNNATIVFDPSAADIDYTLLDTVTIEVPNGFFSFLKNIGTKKVSVKPFGATLVNNYYSNANPLVLSPGAGGYLVSDSIGWYFIEGAPIAKDTVATPIGTFNTTAVNLFAHKLEKPPTHVELWARCLVANQNWNIGDIHRPLRLSNQTTGGNNDKLVTIYADATNVAVINLGGALLFQNKTTALAFTPANPNWEVFCRCKL